MSTHCAKHWRSRKPLEVEIWKQLGKIVSADLEVPICAGFKMKVPGKRDVEKGNVREVRLASITSNLVKEYDNLRCLFELMYPQFLSLSDKGCYDDAELIDYAGLQARGWKWHILFAAQRIKNAGLNVNKHLAQYAEFFKKISCSNAWVNLNQAFSQDIVAPKL